MKRLASVGQIFSPGAPIDQYKLFAGRASQVKDVLNAVNQRGRHAILYGERGVGKTSLANVLADILQHGGYKGLKSGTVNCDGTDDFSSLWRKIFREMIFVYKKKGLGFSGEDIESKVSLDQVFPGRVTPDDVRHVLDVYMEGAIIVIDELDRISDKETKTMIADTIKNLSDHSSKSTIILVGVADSVDELIFEHESVERALAQVPMPRMSSDETKDILDRGYEELEMTITDSAKGKIVRFSQGLPHFTHLLALHATQEAITNDRNKVNTNDVNKAIEKSLHKAQQSIVNRFHRATSSPRKNNLFARVLIACALAEKDDLGYFAAADVRKPMTDIMGRPYDIPAFSRHLNEFCSEKRGPVLQKIGDARRYRFRFINPLMQPFVLMHGYSNDFIDDDMVERSRAR